MFSVLQKRSLVSRSECFACRANKGSEDEKFRIYIGRVCANFFMIGLKSVLIAMKAELLKPPMELFLLPFAVYLVETIEGRVLSKDIE